MDKGDVEMVVVEKNIPASDILVFNEYPINYENGVKTEGLISISKAEDKTMMIRVIQRERTWKILEVR